MNTLYRALAILPAIAASVLAQGAGSTLVDFGGDITDRHYVDTIVSGRHLYHAKIYSWEITRAENGDKTFTFNAKQCIYTTFLAIADAAFFITDLTTPSCTSLSKSDAALLDPIAAALVAFDNLAPTVRHTVVYTELATPLHPKAILSPKSPTNPQLIAFNGFTYDFLKFDLATNKIKTSVVLAPQARVFAVRPTSVDASEVWVGHSGLTNQISLVDLAAGKILGTIPLSSIDPNNEATGLVFTNGGATALYTAKFFQQDAAGNRGALVVLDAATRKIRSTQLLNFYPAALLMAPDGLTAYLVGDGKIVYYDVLSGTSDLSAPFTYVSSTNAFFIHPDGTRMFWDQGTQLSILDLTTRKVILTPKYNFPNNALTSSVTMSQDGSTIYATDGKGNVVVLGTRYGDVVSTYQTGATVRQVLAGPAVN